MADNLTDPSYELLDPCPDVHSLFVEFNKRYFEGRLAAVEVRWSPRMTSCAGVCVYQGRLGLCSVRLSTPLLKLRPRKDLIETLLHEMIHAYLFVTQRNQDRDGHGPEFQQHMHRINRLAGTRITIYHSFHAEVALYKQHWWRCTGGCRNRRPFFGFVKRASNRAPGPNDLWWKQHQSNCGGKFEKVREPEGYSKRKEKKVTKRKTSVDPQNISSVSKSPVKTLDDYFGKKSKGSAVGGVGNAIEPSTSSDVRKVPAFSGTSQRLGGATTLPGSLPCGSRVGGCSTGTSGVGRGSGRSRLLDLYDQKADGKVLKPTNHRHENGATRSRLLDLYNNDKESIKTNHTKHLDESGISEVNMPFPCTSRQRFDSDDEVICLDDPKPALNNTMLSNSVNLVTVEDLIWNDEATMDSSYVDVSGFVFCPSCNARLAESLINDHLDYCVA